MPCMADSRGGSAAEQLSSSTSEILPYAADAWYDPPSVKVGYEMSFTRYFYKPEPMRPLSEIMADIKALERESEGLLGEILATSLS